jgi:DNA recombination protein RmuC
MTALFIAMGTIAGVILGWVLALLCAKSSESGIETELRQQLSNKEHEISIARSREVELIGEKTAAITARELAEQQLATSSKHIEKSEARIQELQKELLERSKELSISQAKLNAANNLLLEKQNLYETQLKEGKETQERAIADLRDTFRALSAEALTQNAPEFLRLATESFSKFHEAAKGELATRQESIAGLLEPLKEQLRTYQQRLQQSESAQSAALGEVKNQLETLTNHSEVLANETARFRMVLKSSQARGRWGEETLRRVVEASGMSAHCDFVEQTKEADKIPDMIVRLPGERIIIIDAKTPDLDFLAVLDNADLEKRTSSLQDHARKLKVTIQDLANRDYPSLFSNSLDYVVLFLPAESLFSAALEGDGDLLIWAASKRVMLATPASLIGLLRCVCISWQQFAQTENAQAIVHAAQELYERVATFTEHFNNIRTGLTKTNEAFNKAVGSYETRVRPSGERLQKLGVATNGKELADVQSTEAALRLLANSAQEAE